MKNKLKKVIVCISFAFMFLLIICYLPFLNRFFDSFSLSFASGESMYPSIKDGDLIVSCSYEIEKDKLGVGMIVGFWDNYDGEIENVHHRIIDISNEGIETRGDNNDTPDEGIKKYSQIKSIYCFKIPFHYCGIGKIRSFLLLCQGGLAKEMMGYPSFYFLLFFLLVCLIIANRKR